MTEDANLKSTLIDPDVLARLSRLDIKPRGLVEGSFSGMHKSPHRGSSVEFAEYRKYVPGDGIKDVDWRVYAKSDRFYVKEFEADTNLRCHLVLDASGSMNYDGGRGSKFDYARRMAATLAQLLIQQGDAVGLQCFSDRTTRDIPARTSPRHLGYILQTLQDTAPDGGTDIVGVLHALAEKIRRRAMVLVFSDFFMDPSELLDCFQHMRFRKHDLAIFHMLDPDELEFDFDRSIRFQDLESPFSVVTEPGVIKAAYRRELESYLAEIREGCTEFKVDYRRTLVSEPYDKALTEFLLDRQRPGTMRGNPRSGLGRGS